MVYFTLIAFFTIAVAQLIQTGLCMQSHSVVIPKSIHVSLGRDLNDLANEIVQSPELLISIDLHGTERILDLRLQRNLLPENFTEMFQRNGTMVLNRPDAKDIELCHYRGTIRNESHSWAAISVCHGKISGSVYDGHTVHHISPDFEESPSDGSFGKHKVHHSLTHESALCDDSVASGRQQLDASANLVRGKRATPKILPEPYGVSARTRYVEMVLVVDNKVYLDLKSDMATVKRRCKDIANIVNALYAPLNVYIALVGMVIWSEKDEISLSAKGDETLTNFLHYRKMRLVHDIPNDNAQLITGVQFQGGVVGKALKGPICTFEFSGGVSMDHSPIVGLVATTVAHELGHNFGMEHDNDTQCICPDDRCIMAASSSSISPTRWSSCSVDSLNHAFDHGMDYCLHNKPKSLVEGPVCGNMFLEPGEECDCGLSENCNNPCCNAATCKLFPNATCGTGPCCDLRTCRLKNAGSECRSARGDCDLSEFCNGNDEFCPNDVFKQDGITCAEDMAHCFQGKCSTHSDQCRLLWGSSGKNSDPICYRQNIHGNRTGHCGYDRPNQNYSKCIQDDILCGVLHCSHLNERLEFGMESVSILSHSFYNVGGKIIPCRTASIDLGLDNPDPGLVPNGAKCGDNKMCLNQKCVSVSSVIGTGCPFDCHQNGICNSNMKCHCKPGFAPPHCDYPGFGGSEDSGPAMDPMGSTTMYLMTFFFLGLIPVLILLGFCYYYYRNPEKRQQLWRFKQFKSNVPQRPDILPIHLMTAESNSRNPPKDDQQNGTARRNLFGKYKGFTLSPLSEQPEDLSPTSPQGLPKLPPPKPAPPGPGSRMVSSFASTFGQKAVLRPAPCAPPHTTVSNSVTVTPSSQGVVAARRPVISGPIPIQNQGGTTAAPPQGLLPLRPAPLAPKERKMESPTNLPLLETVKIVSRVEETVTSVLPSPRTEKRQRPVSSPTAFTVKPAVVKDDDSTGEQESRNFSNPFSSFRRFFRADSKQLEPEKINKIDGDGTLKKNLKRLDRQSLRNLDISAPIAQETQLSVKVVPVRPAPVLPVDVVDGTVNRVRFSGNVSESEDENPRSSVERTNSMRLANVTQKPKIPKFGSMRRTKRPVSMPSVRPTSPPPNPPAPPVSTIPKKDYVFIKEKSPEYMYDDCLSKKELITPDDLSENFYENIDEKSGESKQTDEDDTSAGSDDGLLSEIVSELSKKDNVYATAMKKSDRNTPEPFEQKMSPVLSAAMKRGPNSSGSPGGNFAKTKEAFPQIVATSKPLTSLISKPLFPPAVTSSSNGVAKNNSQTPFSYAPKPIGSSDNVVLFPKFPNSVATTTSQSISSMLGRPLVATSAANRTPTNVSTSVPLNKSSAPITTTSNIFGSRPITPVILSSGLNKASASSVGATSNSINSPAPVPASSGASPSIAVNRPIPFSSSNVGSSFQSSRYPAVAAASPALVSQSSAPLGASEGANGPTTVASGGVPFSYLNLGLRSTVLARPVATIIPNTISSSSLLVSKPSLLASLAKPSLPGSGASASGPDLVTPSMKTALAASLVTKSEKKPPPLPAVGPVADVVTGVGSILVERPDYASQPEPKVITNTTVTFSVSAPVVASKPNVLNLNQETAKAPSVLGTSKQVVKPKIGRVTSPVRTTVKPVPGSVTKPVVTGAVKSLVKTVPSKPSPIANGVSVTVPKVAGVKKPVSAVQSKINTGIKK